MILPSWPATDSAVGIIQENWRANIAAPNIEIIGATLTKQIISIIRWVVSVKGSI